MPILLGISIATAVINVGAVGALFYKINKEKREVTSKIDKATTVITQASEALKDL